MIIQVISTESQASLSSVPCGPVADQVLFHLLANDCRNFNNISNVLGVTRQTIFQVGRSSEKQFLPTEEKIYNYHCSLCEYYMCDIVCCGKCWCGSTSITINIFIVVLTLLAQYNACYVENSFHTHRRKSFLSEHFVDALSNLCLIITTDGKSNIPNSCLREEWFFFYSCKLIMLLQSCVRS